MYIEYVKGTLKGGCDVRLSQRTVIVGPNESGKSTIVQTAELATKGEVTDMEGRARVRQQAALARLFPSGVSPEAYCQLSDGTQFSWRLEPKGRTSFSLHHEAPMVVEWALQDVQAILAGEPAKVSTWLEGLVVGPLDDDEILKEMPPDFRPATEDLLSRYVGNRNFTTLAKAAKDEARRLRTQATTQEKTVARMLTGLTPPLLDSEREELEQRLEAYGALAGTTTQEAYDAQVARAKQDEVELSRLQAAMRTLRDPPENVLQIVERLSKVKEILADHVKHCGLDVCQVCGREDADQAIRARAGALAQALSQYADQAQLLQTRRKLQDEISSLEATLQERKAALSAAVVETNGEERKALTQKLEADRQARKAWQNATAARHEIQRLRDRADTLSAVAKELVPVGQALLAKRVHLFTERVQALLPGDQVGVDLAAGRLGFKRGPDLHSALSGAEWSRLLLALASVWREGSTPCVLVPEDRAWDRDTLTQTMKALSSVPHMQILLMSTVEPEPVTGWTVISLPARG